MTCENCERDCEGQVLEIKHPGGVSYLCGLMCVAQWALKKIEKLME